MAITETETGEILSVSLLNEQVRGLLESSFSPLWVQGEISNVAQPASGHLYLTIKDAACQISCVMYRARCAALTFTPENGLDVLVHGKISLYPQRGAYQIVIDAMLPAGTGRLQLQYEALKKRLGAEGLFTPERKRPVPRFPRRIGVVTSRTGAALHDVLVTLQRRQPQSAVVVYPTAVQGGNAKAELVTMLNTANRRSECQVLLLVRGGGSIEDLWTFNEESVVRAIYASVIPVITGIGHETDVTIADLVADARAATPTAAAEIASSFGREAILETLQTLKNRARDGIRMKCAERREHLKYLQDRLYAGKKLITNAAMRLDWQRHALMEGIRLILSRARARTERLDGAIHMLAPYQLLGEVRSRLNRNQKLLLIAMQQRLVRSKKELTHHNKILHALSPLEILARGYAVLKQKDGLVITHATQTVRGDNLVARLAHGSLECSVNNIINSENPHDKNTT